MSLDEIEGGQATLTRVRASPKLVEEFKKRPNLRKVCGIQKDQDLAFFKYLMADDELLLLIWDITPSSVGKSIGYACFVGYDGPPFITFYYFDEEPHLDVSRELLEAMIQVFFNEAPDEPSLYFYLPRPVDDDIHAHLIEGGFDVFDDNPTLDNDEVACYVLERYTYDAYYGEGGKAQGEFEDYDE